ncbi:MAG: VWA domain-containing protein [Acidobacteria bacterium]|nr:VWA domain-containing protein [Acidobacteriota bacterium]MBI3423550.1 VWA domain-containing protein [Acidobacteriota bacterium]
MPKFRFLLAMICLYTLAHPQLLPQTSAQNKPPDKPQKEKEDETTLKLTTELIEVRAVVTDKAGHPISGLTKDDFELLENDKPQEISFFSFTRVPGQADGNTAAEQPASPSATLANAVTAKPARSIVLFADNAHIAAGNLLFLKQSLRKFIDDKLSTQDLTALITSFGTLGLGEQFTRDRRLLRYAAERLSIGPSERVSLFTPYLAGLVDRDDPEGLNEAIRLLREEDGVMGTDRRTLIQLAKARASEVLGIASYRSRATLFTLRSVIDRLAQMPGQRLLVIFSDGFTLLDSTGRFDGGELQAVTSRATRSGVVIYTIDSRGLTGPPGMDVQFRTQPNFSIASAGEHDLQDGLNALAADTGGKFFRNTNDLMGAAKQALDENEVYYTLAYYPAEEGNANKFRKLSLRVKGHPEYRIRTQKGYLPSALARNKKEVAKTPEQRLAQQMVEPLAVTDVGVFATAEDVEYQGDAAQVTLKVTLDGQTIATQPGAGDHQLMEVKVALMVFDKVGKLAFNQADTIKGDLRPASYQRLRAGGFSYYKRLTLKPGFYQIRVGVYEPKTEHTGTASAVVEVPDLKSKKLLLSSLVILGELQEFEQASQPANANANANTNANAPQAKIVQGIRFFQRQQAVVYYCRLYQNAAQAAPAEDMELQTEVWQNDKVLGQGEWVPLTSRIQGRDNKGLTLAGQTRLLNLKDGIYELRFKVRVKGKKSVAQRVAVFGVEG